MTSFKAKPPSPRAHTTRPTYPRLVGLGILALTAACSGTVAGAGDNGSGGTGALAGGMEPSFDAAPDSAGGSGGIGGSGGYGATGGWATGTGGVAFDSGSVEPDAGSDAEPPPDGFAAPPWDGGVDAADAPLPDAELSGGDPGPFDAASCEASIDPY